ncbi:hypothetical protein C3941_03815 [Kaistia algarum]|uniref:hypothetical protein n=1 Tax=Kaistia algarum TaxID=2083279 RepID=UPI000CE74AD4|nr:hypothetical protein [Kaistia algarum]MCX5512659.1 hypothetical protein [Kaistia algarum]PPE81829.1 hypothetical protein C3941_03815 [Kaistia algarum]
MSNFKLSLPTDIPWERICVTEDMIDPRICDERFPAKWQTSMAVFKYLPEEENQIYPKYRITYLKVTATLTGYQPLDQEVQGTIDWNGVNVTTIPGLTELLNSYNPCHGAILQVLVGPKEGEGKLPRGDYPFFIDFEPKKRELYELATDTKEKQSRSIESLNVTKSSGSTQSMEILDVDMGGGGVSAQGSYAGTGGGFSYTAPNGQWGTKQLNAQEGMSSRSSDVGTEKRETFSFSTQISQMYHLLDSYHLGTNRAVFFVQPRPHVLEEPSGFVRGPRPVEGIQEFFLVVAQLKEQKDFCVALRLDTSHLTTTPIMDYDRKSESTSIASANAPVATDHDIPAERIVGARACFIECWDVHYQCYRTEKQDTVTYDAPAGYRIDSYNDLINEATHGSTSVVVTPNGHTLNINAQAVGHICYEGSEVCVDCPDTIQSWAGHARRQVQVNLISTTPTKQIGEEQVLMITTRGLCCCASDRGQRHLNEMVVAIRPIPAHLAVSRAAANYATRYASANAGAAPMQAMAAHTHAVDGEPCVECAEKARAAIAAAAPAAASMPLGRVSESRYTLQQVNELSNYMRTETLKSLNDPTLVPQRFIDTNFFAKQLEYKVLQSRLGRELVRSQGASKLPKEVVSRVAGYLKKDAKAVSLEDVLTFRSADLARITGLDEAEAQRMKLAALGVAFKGGSGKKDDGASTAKRK